MAFAWNVQAGTVARQHGWISSIAFNRRGLPAHLPWPRCRRSAPSGVRRARRHRAACRRPAFCRNRRPGRRSPGLTGSAAARRRPQPGSRFRCRQRPSLGRRSPCGARPRDRRERGPQCRHRPVVPVAGQALAALPLLPTEDVDGGGLLPEGALGQHDGRSGPRKQQMEPAQTRIWSMR